MSGLSNHPSGEMLGDVLLKLAILSVLDSSGTVLREMNKLMSDRNAKSILVGLEYLDLEIIPALSTFELRQNFSNLSYSECRKVKRKFRKIHRKLRSSLEKDNRVSQYELNLWFGAPGVEPDRYQKSSRKSMVRDFVMQKFKVDEK